MEAYPTSNTHNIMNPLLRFTGITFLVAGLLTIAACAPTPVMTEQAPQPEEEPAPEPPAAPEPAPAPEPPPPPVQQEDAMDSDPRVGLGAGLFDAEEAIWNLSLVSTTPPPEAFIGVTNSDLAFIDHYAIQGNYNGIQIWDITNPAEPEMAVEYVCPASQSDVSVYENLLFVSGEGFGGRLDCGTEGVRERVSQERLRGIRIFDITDIKNPEYVANVQTCRGSHTHSVLKDPDDDENVYVYVSGSAPVRPAEEVPGCSSGQPDEDPNTALFRIEVIKVPLADPTQAAIVSSPRIFDELMEPPTHGLAPDDLAIIEDAKASGKYVAVIFGQERVVPDRMVRGLLDEIVKERGGEGDPSAADSMALRESLADIIAERFGIQAETDEDDTPGPGPTQCHDITLYPEIGLAGGACEGYGLLLDIEDPVNPKRIDAVADSNFSYWHSATFSNDGSKILFTDEWGGGGGPKCRASDPMEWGANAIFTLEDGKMVFKSYYKLPAAQTSLENCVAHNGSLIPIPGRDIFVQAWYQGGISISDWTDPSNPVEIAFHDRGPVSAEGMQMGGSWSVYWYNGAIYSSEIARGLDVFELIPSEYLTENEIAAANTVELEYLNAQGQPTFHWPATFALALAYVDQLERANALTPENAAPIREMLSIAEAASGDARTAALSVLDMTLDADEDSAAMAKARKLADVIKMLGSPGS